METALIVNTRLNFLFFAEFLATYLKFLLGFLELTSKSAAYAFAVCTTVLVAFSSILKFEICVIESLFLACFGQVERNSHSGRFTVLLLLPANLLDMLGVTLKATYMGTRKVNGDELQDIMKNTLGPRKAGKFIKCLCS